MPPELRYAETALKFLAQLVVIDDAPRHPAGELLIVYYAERQYRALQPHGPL